MKEKQSTFSEAEIRKDIISEAKVIGLPKGAAETFADKAVIEIVAALKKRRIITEKDLDIIMVRVLKKYSKDLAYVFEIRGKIV